MNAIGFGFLSIALFAGAAICRPPRAACPDGWRMNGARPDGSFECLHKCPPGGDEDNGRDRCPPQPSVRSRVHCTGGSEPIAGNDGLTVGCQARH